MKQLNFQHRKKTILLNVLILFCACCILFLNHQIILEHSSHYANLLVSGSLFGDIFHQFNLKDMIAFSYLYKILYSNFPTIPWFPLSLIICLVLSLSLLLDELIRKIYIPYSIPLIIQSIASITILSTILPHLIFLEHNRTSFILGTIGFWILLNYPVRTIRYFMGVLLFVLSILFRIEAATGVIVLVLPLIVMWYGVGIKKYLSNLSFPLAILIAAHAIFIYKTSFSEEHYYQIEPDFEYEIMNKKNVVELSEMKSKNDTIKYQMVNNWLLMDVDTLNPEFIRSLINKSNHSVSKYNLIPVSKDFSPFLQFFPPTLISPEFAIFILSIISIILLSKRKIKTSIILSIYAIFILAILYLVIGSIHQKIEARFFNSVFSIAIISIWLIFFSKRTDEFHKNIYHYFIAFALAIVLLQSCKQHQLKIQKINEKTKFNNSQRMILKASEQNIIIYMGNYELFKYLSNPFIIESSFGDKKFFHFRFAQYSDTENYRQILKSTMSTQQIKYADILSFFTQHIESVVVIASPEIIQLWTLYNKELYQLDFNTHKINNNFNSDGDLMYSLSLKSKN